MPLLKKGLQSLSDDSGIFFYLNINEEEQN
jgi:hypothetical protein